jgi:predicted nucleic acid-binding protein
MALVLDTGPVAAALNAADPDHGRCAALLSAARDPVVLSTVLVEVDYWLVKLGGAQVWVDFVADLTAGAYRLMHPGEDDLRRASDLELTYRDLGLGLVDASVIALCERLGETEVATLDHRHFSVVQPRHCARLTLLPD